MGQTNLNETNSLEIFARCHYDHLKNRRKKKWCSQIKVLGYNMPSVVFWVCHWHFLACREFWIKLIGLLSLSDELTWLRRAFPLCLESYVSCKSSTEHPPWCSRSCQETDRSAIWRPRLSVLSLVTSSERPSEYGSLASKLSLALCMCIHHLLVNALMSLMLYEIQVPKNELVYHTKSECSDQFI